MENTKRLGVIKRLVMVMTVIVMVAIIFAGLNVTAFAEEPALEIDEETEAKTFDADEFEEAFWAYLKEEDCEELLDIEIDDTNDGICIIRIFTTTIGDIVSHYADEIDHCELVLFVYDDCHYVEIDMVYTYGEDECCEYSLFTGSDVYEIF